MADSSNRAMDTVVGSRGIRRRVVMADTRLSRGMVDIRLSRGMVGVMEGHRRDSMGVGMGSSSRRRNMGLELAGGRRWGWEGGCWEGCCLGRRWMEGMGGMEVGMEVGIMGVVMMVEEEEGIFR